MRRGNLDDVMLLLEDCYWKEGHIAILLLFSGADASVCAKGTSNGLKAAQHRKL